MKIGFYNPYLDSLGGGERYTLTLASHWSASHAVDLFWDDTALLDKAQARLGIDLSRVRVVKNVFNTKNILAKLLVSQKYDCIFFLTDGSVPTSLARYNILHFQAPFAHIHSNPIAIRRVTEIVCNSKYTRDHIEKSLQGKAHVIYPPVRQVAKVNVAKKKKIILSVGRFTPMHDAKKQSLMIDAFIAMEKRVPEWTLMLVGGCLAADIPYLSMLKAKALGCRIVIQENIAYEALQDAYRDSSIYWHAAGFGETDPMYHEHFGITTVEAASAGVVPLVYAGGGQKEIIQDDIDGLLWKTPEELIEKTLVVISKANVYKAMQNQAMLMWKKYSEASFQQSYDSLLASFT